MLGTEKIEKKIRRLSWMGQRPTEDDLASQMVQIVVDSGNWTIRAPKELVWEVVMSSQPGCTRNTFLRVDKHDHVVGNQEGNATAETSFTAEPTVSSCREGCKLRDAKYKKHRDEQQACENKRLAQKDEGSNAPASPTQKSAEELSLEKLMSATHATHDQWAVTYSSPPKGKGQRWMGGDSSTTYHTLSADTEDACTYWIEEHVRYRPASGKGGPGMIPPGLWEKTLRGMAETIKGICEKEYAERVKENKSESAKGKERASLSSNL